MNTKIFFIIIVFIANFRLCQGRRYDDFIMYSAVPIEKYHLKFLQNLDTQNYIELIFWKKPSKLYETVQLIVAAKDNAEFRERCKHFGLEVKQMHDNVQELFDKQNVVQETIPLTASTYTWDQYHTLDNINKWMMAIADSNPKICKLLQIGKSFENRNIYALSIVRKNTKGTVIVEAGMHGNEWISTEFVTFLAQNLLDIENTDDNRILAVASTYEWLLVPVVNPDGFQYSHTWDRMWRKNRRFFENTTYGVDLNRNFDYSFCQFGSSRQKESDVYCGSKPFSEPESEALSTFILENSKNLKYYFSFHAYGQKIIIPFGDKILHVDNYAEVGNYGKQAIMNIYKLYGTKYSIGNSYDTLGHKISGNSASWVKNTFHVPFVYTFLLRDTGTYGYGMPPSEILPTCEEALTAVLEIMTTHVKKLRADLFSDLSSSGGRGTCGLLWLGVAVFWLAK